MLRGHEADLGTFLTSDPKGKRLPAYLAELAGHLDGEQAVALRELAHLQKNIEHIKDIVAMQQNSAKVSGAMEIAPVCDLVEDALKMCSSALVSHGINVIRDFRPVKPINIQKHQVLQILVNLIRNAKQACDETGRPDKRLTIRIANGEDHVNITVIDNGVGIAPENLTRIFAHGFTTKKDGHGFGLHSGALAAKEMGGSLTVHSGGLGCGTMFTLGLPMPMKPNQSN
jgi:signal transduction histidine kinase